MAKNRKYFPNNAVVLITTRVEEGVPLVPTDLVNLIVRGIFARATFLFNVRICHFIVMGNHLHLILLVTSGEDVSAFMGYVKGEIAHSVNRLLGRRQKTIWHDGYDSPPILTTDDLVRYVKYIYLNPIRAKLTPSIEGYPGVSSWEMFGSDQHSLRCKHVPRTTVPHLRTPQLSINEQRKLTEKLSAKCEVAYDLKIEPYACFEAMPDYDGRSHQLLKAMLVEEIHRAADELREENRREGYGYIGATALRRQSMLRPHTPETFGKRMICICSNLDLRKQYIEYFRSLAQQAALAYSEWKKGIFTRRIPPGMFAPRMPCYASALRPY